MEIPINQKGIPPELQFVGRHTYIYDSKPMPYEVAVFEVWISSEDDLAQIQESDEMRPHWFQLTDIKHLKMWADDVYWLPDYLNCKLALPFDGLFRFKGHEGPSAEIIYEHKLTKLVWELLLLTENC